MRRAGAEKHKCSSRLKPVDRGVPDELGLLAVEVSPRNLKLETRVRQLRTFRGSRGDVWKDLRNQIQDRRFLCEIMPELPPHRRLKSPHVSRNKRERDSTYDD